VVLILIIIFPIILISSFFIPDLDFIEIRRLREHIEKDLKTNLSDLPELINRESYGWAEEGGDISLLKLNSNDCPLVSSLITETEEINIKSDYMKMFIKNKLNPVFLKSWFYENKHGDFTKYVFDSGSCVLFRRYHYE